MILLIDAGNTRLKWARLVNTVLTARGAQAHRNLTADDLESLLKSEGAGVSRVVISNVAGASLQQTLKTAIQRAIGIEPEFVQATLAAGGVRNGYANPAQLGVDRWLAMIGARATITGNACVVSVGTAMTIDGLTAAGHHLGGVIVPGPDMMEASLLKGTGELAARSASGTDGSTLFATDTRAAIRQGAQYALGALVTRAIDELRRQTGDDSVLVLSGGAADRVIPQLEGPYELVPDLVLRGLAVLALESPSGAK